MLNVSNAFNEAFKSPTRQVLVRVTMKNVVYTNNDVFNVEYTGGSITGETFNIGSVFSNSIKITFTKVIEAIKQLDKIKLEFGIVLADGSREFVSMGYFFVDKYNPDRNANRTVIEALDQMTQLERVYKSKLTYPARIKDVALEIANLSGSVVDQASFERLSTSAIIKFEGKTYRQAIGLIAQFGGGFAIFDRDGKLSIRTLSDPNFSISTAEYFSRGLVKNETMYTLGGISCKVTTKNGDTSTDFMLQSGSPLGNQIVLENSSMTQILLDGIYQQLKNTNYYPYTLSWRGNPALEAGDWISMSDTKANSFKMPNLTYKLSFSGGLKATSSADTSSVSQASASYRGPINQQLIELQGWKSAAGGWTYTGTTEPSTPKEGDVWFKPNGPDSETWIYEGGKWVFQTSTAGIRQVTEEMNQAQKDIVDAKKVADDAVDKANANVQAIEANAQLITDVNAIANTAKSQAQTAATNAQTALTSANTAITNANKAISDAGKLSEDVLALDTIANQAKSDADTALINANKGITDAKTALDKATGVNTRVTTEITNVNNTLAAKANSTTVDALSDTVSSQGTAISQNATDIKLKADSTAVNAIKGTVDSQGTLISQNSKDIALKANQSSVDTLTGRVSANETAIDITAQGVSTLVTKTDSTNTSLSQFKQDYEGFKGTVYSKTQTDTKISTVQSTVDNFKTTVSNTYSSKTETDSKVTAVQANVDKIGNHTAYAYSTDGTDRFTTAYPNLNLLTDSKEFKNKNIAESAAATSITSDSTIVKDGNDTYLKFIKSTQNQDWFRAYINRRTQSPNFTNVDIKGNTKYTFSVWLKGTGTHTLIAYDSWTNPINARTDFTLTSDWKLYTFTVLSRPTADLPADKMVQFFIRSGTVGSEINLKYPKVEEGSTATPYMPSEKELTSNDIPKYVGYSVRQSENPKDFSWQPYGGFNSYKIIEATTSIEQNSKEIALKSNKSEVDTLSGRVSTAEGSITTMAGQIALKASKTDVDTVKGRVTSAEGAISLISGQVALKANQADVNTTNGKVSSLESSFTVQSGQITALNTKTDGHTTQIGSLQSSYNGLISTVADVSAIQVGGQNLLLGTATAKTSTITQTNNFSTLDPYNFSVSKFSAFNFEVDDYITLSFDWETTSTTGSVRPEINLTPYGFGNVISAKGTSGVTSNTKTITASEQRGHIEIVFKVVSSSKISEATKLRLRFDGHQLNSTFTIKNAKLEKGNKATDWCMAPQEVANQSQITQLASDINLRVSKGDVTSQINIEAGRTLIDTKQLLLNADTVKFSGSAFIPNAMIQNLSAEKITAGTLNAANVNVINLNAANITTGTLTGHNLSINLNSGEVLFQKGIIKRQDGNFSVDITNGILESYTSSGGYTLRDGEISFRDTSAWKPNSREKYGGIGYNNFPGGIWSGAVSGISVRGNEGWAIGTSNSDVGGTEATKGSLIAGGLERATFAAKKQITITAGDVYENSIFSAPPAIQVGTGNSSNEILISSKLTTIGDVLVSELRVDRKATISQSLTANSLNVTGSKNAIHATRNGVRATPAYETAESYLGDIGSNYTREDCEVWIDIDKLFSDTVNTDIAYQVFLQAYDDTNFWVADFKSEKFLIKSDKPMSRFAWEIKAKRRGYENDRLVLQDDFDNKKIEEAWREK